MSVTASLDGAETATRNAGTEVEHAFDRLSAELAAAGFEGHDPYDALASPLLAACARGRLARLVQCDTHLAYQLHRCRLVDTPSIHLSDAQALPPLADAPFADGDGA